jgi:hypothetical protein
MHITNDGYSVMATASNKIGTTWPAVIADISDIQNGSITKYYKSGTGGFGPYDNALSKCQ